MREIKFRAWIKAKKEMQTIDFLDFRYKKIGLNNEEYLKEFSNCELMQYTGLKDKKGKEIYEGDIVADILDGEILMVGDIQFDCGTFGVEWVDFKKNKSMVGAWGQKHNLRRLDDDIVDRIEVIGNIYENEELLRGLK